MNLAADFPPMVHGHRVHRVGQIRKHLAAFGAKITLFFLPPHAYALPVPSAAFQGRFQ